MYFSIGIKTLTPNTKLGLSLYNYSKILLEDFSQHFLKAFVALINSDLIGGSIAECQHQVLTLNLIWAILSKAERL